MSALVSPKRLPPATLDDAFRRVIRSGSVILLAKVTKIPAARLYRYATHAENPSNEYRAAPANVILPLTAATGQLDIIEYLADQVGCNVVKRPTGANGSLPILQRAGALTTEFADVLRGCGEALRDGRITHPEACALERDLTELEAQAEALRLMVRSLVRKPLAKAGVPS